MTFFPDRTGPDCWAAGGETAGSAGAASFFPPAHRAAEKTAAVKNTHTDFFMKSSY
jgi:hypothetical protein